MRFATCEPTGRCTPASSRRRLHPLPGGTTVLDLVRPAAGALERPAAPGRPGRAAGGVRLLPPLDPPTVRDFVAFEEHVEGVVASVGDGAGVVPEWYEAPTFYFTNPYALVGAHDDVPVPPGSELLDFELEVAVVVGRDGASLTPGAGQGPRLRVHDHERLVGPGPAAAGDEGQPGTGQGQGLGHHAGPVAGHRRRTRALPRRRRLPGPDLRVSVNGAEVGQDLLSNMGWPFEDLISYASRGTWVRAGDVLGSGTCGNGGCLAELWGRRGRIDPPPLRPGDVVEMTVEGIGTIRNRVVPGLELPPVRPARPRPRNPEAGRVSRSSSSPAPAGPGRGRGPAARRPGRDRHRLRPDAEPAEDWPGASTGSSTSPTRRLGRARQDLPTVGRVDGLVANAGITWRARLLDARPGRPARVHEVNVTGTLLAIQALAPLMTAAGRSSWSARSPR
jgi:2-keto-4-pentenoate hydratase/2-oxohepta-3-ene-1,7-dioic acid hydratase in catechol pathway